MEAIHNYRPDLTFPIAVDVLNVLADANPALPAKERQYAIQLARNIEVHLGVSSPPTGPTFDQRLIDVARDAYVAGNYTDAVRRAYVELINEVKRRGPKHRQTLMVWTS